MPNDFVLCFVDKSHRRILNLTIFHKHQDGSIKDGDLKEVGLDAEKNHLRYHCNCEREKGVKP